MPWPLFLMVLTSAVMHAMWNFAARKVKGDMVVMWLGVCLASVLCLPFAVSVEVQMETLWIAFPHILGTGFFHALYFGLLAKAYTTGEISVVYPIARGTGVGGTSILAVLLFKEDISLFGSFGIVAICLGVVLLGLKHTDSQHGYHPVFMALAVGLSIISYSLIDKLGVAKVQPVFYIWAMYVLTGLFLGPHILLRYRHQCWVALLNAKIYIFIIGIGSMGTYLIILFAFQLGKVSYIVAIREFSVVIGSLLGIIFLKETFHLRKALGITVIALGMMMIKAYS